MKDLLDAARVHAEAAAIAAMIAAGGTAIGELRPRSVGREPCQ